jgi:hypothetical protein
MCKAGDSCADRRLRVRTLLAAKLDDAVSVARVHRAVEAAVRAPRDSMVVQDVVADVIADTYAGTLYWDPEHVSLWTHLTTEAKRRIGRERRAAAMHTSLTVLGNLVPPVETSDEADRDSGEYGDPADIVDELHRRSANDIDVLRLLKLFSCGITRKARILELGVSEATYRNARRRLTRLALAAKKKASFKSAPRPYRGTPIRALVAGEPHSTIDW